MTNQELSAMQNADLLTADTRSLVDIRQIRIDPSLPVPQKVEDFMVKSKNPYLFQVGDITVKLHFDKTGRPLRDALVRVLQG